MSRYLNFYFNPWEASSPGSMMNFTRIYLHESDCCEVPWCKEPPCGGIGSDDGGQDGIIGVIFSADTTPPTLVRNAMGIPFCAKFNHPDYPRFYIANDGAIYECVTGKPTGFLSQRLSP